MSQLRKKGEISHFGNFMAGFTQASLVTLVGYPFDTVKVIMQKQKHLHTPQLIGVL